MDILRVLGFKVSSSPTSYEFATSYLEQVLGFSHKEKEFVTKMTIYLAKMSVHHHELCTKQSSLIGASSIYVALKICEQMRQKTILTKDKVYRLIESSSLAEKELMATSKSLLYLAQNFEKELPGLENLKNAYITELNKFVQ
jgi:hypothetical protein